MTTTSLPMHQHNAASYTVTLKPAPQRVCKLSNSAHMQGMRRVPGGKHNGDGLQKWDMDGWRKGTGGGKRGQHNPPPRTPTDLHPLSGLLHRGLCTLLHAACLIPCSTWPHRTQAWPTGVLPRARPCSTHPAGSRSRHGKGKATLCPVHRVDKMHLSGTQTHTGPHTHTHTGAHTGGKCMGHMHGHSCPGRPIHSLRGQQS